MRLINVETFEVEEFLDSQLPAYAILSHKWQTNEVTYEDMRVLETVEKKQGYTKLKLACAQARKDQLAYVWADTCCIDKRSSAELQEAINSMYRYYANADVCYVYLADVSGSCPFLLDGAPRFVIEHGSWRAVFLESEWYTRGWTLQELIAPVNVHFYGRDWNFIGTKAGLIKTISTATGIQTSVLAHTTRTSSVSVAQRMSWASCRETSRVEDRAYSLLGIFGVNMPMLYGEGPKAFIRLQEEIIKSTSDHSIFAWEFEDDEFNTNGNILASSPSNFASCQRIVQWGKPGAFDMTNRGLRINLPVLEPATEHEETFAILNCRYVNNLSGTLALRLRRYGGAQEYHAVKRAINRQYNANGTRSMDGHVSRLTFIPHGELDEAQSSTLQITREFEPEASHLKFWIPESNANPTGNNQFQVIDAHPKETWDQYDGVMHASDQSSVRGAVAIETSSGNRFSVAFGFDSAYECSGPDQYLPGIWGVPWNSGSTLQSFITEKTLSQCDHEAPLCSNGRCPYLRLTATAYEYASTEKLEMRIHKATIMKDTVFVVTLQITDVFELQTVDGLLELDVNTPAQPLSEDVSPALHKFSVLAPLIQGLPWSEKKLRSRVWMHVPASLQVEDVYPPKSRSLANRTIFWPVADDQEPVGAVSFTTSFGTNVILAFAKWLSGYWKIELRGADPDLAQICGSLVAHSTPDSWEPGSDGTAWDFPLDGQTLQARLKVQKLETTDCLIDVRFEQNLQA